MQIIFLPNRLQNTSAESDNWRDSTVSSKPSLRNPNLSLLHCFGEKNYISTIKNGPVDLPQRNPTHVLRVHGLAVISHAAAFASIHSPGPSVSSLSKCCLQPVGSKNTFAVYVVLWWPGNEKSSDTWSRHKNDWTLYICVTYIYIYTYIPVQ